MSLSKFMLHLSLDEKFWLVVLACGKAKLMLGTLPESCFIAYRSIRHPVEEIAYHDTVMTFLADSLIVQDTGVRETVTPS